MKRQEEVYEKLESEFQAFCEEDAHSRRERLPRIEHLISEAKFLNQHVYLSEKCAGFLSHCRQMSRLRQPRSYDDSSCASFARGDLWGIKWILVEGGPNGDGI